MRAGVKDGLFLAGKTVLVLLGGILVSAATVDLAVEGFGVQAAIYLLAGLLLAGVPLGLAFRDAARHARPPPSEEADASTRGDPRGPRRGG